MGIVLTVSQDPHWNTSPHPHGSHIQCSGEERKEGGREKGRERELGMEGGRELEEGSIFPSLINTIHISNEIMQCIPEYTSNNVTT